MGRTRSLPEGGAGLGSNMTAAPSLPNRAEGRRQRRLLGWPVSLLDGSVTVSLHVPSTWRRVFFPSIAESG